MSRTLTGLLCLTALGWIGCTSNVEPAERPPVILGVIAENESEVPARAAVSAIERAVRAAGGLLDSQRLEIHVSTYQQGDASEETPGFVTDLINEGASAVVGPFDDQGALALASATSYAAQMPHFAMFTTNQAIYELQPPTDRYLFIMTPPEDTGTQHLGRVMASKGCTKLLITFYAGGVTFFGTKLANGARAAGINTTLFGPFSTFDDPTYVSIIQSSGYDCIMAFPTIEDMGLLVRSYYQAPSAPPVRWIVPFARGMRTEFMDAVGGRERLDGMLVLSPANLDTSTDAYRSFVGQLRSSGATITDPGQLGYAAFVYDALAVAALGVQSNGSTALGQDLRQAIRDVANSDYTNRVGPGSWPDALSLLGNEEPVGYAGVTGICDFDANQVYQRPIDILEYHHATNSFAVVDTIGAGEAPVPAP